MNSSRRESGLRPVVFDLDGTLIDSRADIAAACNHALEAVGRAPLPLERVAGFVGDGARQLLARAFALPEDAVELDAHLEVFLDFYTAHPSPHTSLYPGVRAVLARLSGRRLAVCTNKPRRTTDAVLSALGLTSAFASVVAGGDTPDRKPGPGPLRRVAADLGVAPELLVMVGDGPQDVMAARAVGAHAVGVRHGFLPLERLVASEPDVLLEGVIELPGYLEVAGL
jgi:phosphoglycolate phosphatase